MGDPESIHPYLQQKNCGVHKYPRADGDEPFAPFTAIEDGQIFRLEDFTLEVYHTPGHTSDSIILHLLVSTTNKY